MAKPSAGKSNDSTGLFTPVKSTSGRGTNEDHDSSEYAYSRVHSVKRPQVGVPKLPFIRHTVKENPLVKNIVAKKRPDPFAGRSSTIASTHASSSSIGDSVDIEPAWGLSRDDEVSVESVMDRGTYTTGLLPVDKATKQADGRSTLVQPLSNRKTARKSQAQEAADPAPGPEPGGLTHVKATGEAHMVDVGDKANTKRVAIAVATVCFTNAEALRLIQENSNKKGDVLGVARIAGIMASKRTSDLIPLCHPIAISKVEVDLQLISKDTSSGYLTKSSYGMVSILAQVECIGPTGVEMEALTAATSAALTVYDMCKAVDRAMDVAHSHVVYKSGGKSGTYGNDVWSKVVGPKFFHERGLTLPESVKPQWPRRLKGRKAR